MPRVRVMLDEALIKEIAFIGGRTSMSVGRKSDNDIVIDNPAVSGHHCTIKVKGDTYFVEDLESTNGTFVNGKKIVKCGLHDADVIGVAKHSLVFVEEKLETPAQAAERESTYPPDSDFSSALGDAVQAKGPDPTLTPEEGNEAIALLKVLKGGVGNVEQYELKDSSTYIGAADRALVRIAGGGFLSKPPEIAASIHRKPDGWILTAVEDGYPKINDATVSGKKQLNDGDIIECGQTTLQFTLKKA
jgi:hypothetical protein